MESLFDVLKKTSEDKMEVFSKYITLTEREKSILGRAILQLTPLCNFSCKMCYAKMTQTEVSKSQKHILRFDEWKWYIDHFKEMGTPVLSFTGGECMTHPDFEQIYRYAYDNGFRIQLLTNGSFVTDQLFDLFTSKPPDCFSITVYGASSKTYQKLCGNGEAYNKVYSNIDRLRQYGFNIMVKYTVTNENLDDLPRVYDYFLQRGIKLRYQNSIMQFNKATANIVEKVSVDEAKYVDIQNRMLGNADKSDTDNIDAISVQNMRSRIGSPQKGIRCSAGRSMCYIRWDGIMTPCVSLDCIALDPRNMGMKEAWKKINKWSAEFPAMTECDSCVHATKCVLCISLHYNDTHIPGVPAPRLCWKRNHPEEAEKIEKRMIEKGIISPDEIYAKEG